MAMTQETIIAAAALVATIALGLLAYTQARRAFARTKACLLAEFLPSSDVGIAFLITIRNTGKYPAFIETVSLRLRTGALIPFRNLHGEGFTSPLRVTDEAPASLYFPIASLMHEIHSPPYRSPNRSHNNNRQIIFIPREDSLVGPRLFPPHPL